MKTFKNLKDFLSSFPPLPSPYTCSDDLVIDDSDKIPYYFLSDKIIEVSTSTYQTEYEESIVPKLTQDEKVKFAFVLLDRYIFSNKTRKNFFLNSKFESVLHLLVSNFKEYDFEIIIDFFKIINDNLTEKNLKAETVFLEELYKQSLSSKLPPKRLFELKRRFKFWEKMYNSPEFTYIFSRDYSLLGKILGKYNPTDYLRQELDASFATGSFEPSTFDGFPLSENDPYLAEHKLIDQLLLTEVDDLSVYNPLFKDTPTIKKLLKADRVDQKNFLMALYYRMTYWIFDGQSFRWAANLVSVFCKKKFPFQNKEIVFVLKAFLHKYTYQPYYFEMSYFFKNLEVFVKENGLKDDLKEALVLFKIAPYKQGDITKLQTKATELLATQSLDTATLVPFHFADQDHFGRMANEELDKLTLEKKILWYDLLRAANTASGGKPNNKFLKKVSPLLDKVGHQDFIKTIKKWLAYFPTMSLVEESQWYKYLVHANNIPTIKGLIWTLSLLNTNELDLEIEKVTQKCYQKLPGIGQTSGAIGNACIYTVGTRKTLASVALLNRIKSKVSQRNTKALIQKHIDATAEELKINVADLEDFSIQDFGLENGMKEIAFNDYTARLSFASFGKTKLEWFKPDGKQQKTIPAFVKNDFAEELKAIRNDAKVIPKTLTIQRDRLDRSYLQKRIFPYEHFRKYYVEHGLMAFLTKKLIWTFSKGKKKTNAIWLNDSWQDLKGKPLKDFDNKTTVELWHPLESKTKEILAWRNFLQEHQIKQPLKQAYREVYILTDAEINTKVYSNRMAAHILKQHQFNVLAGLRGWKYSLMGAYDDGIESQICSMKIPSLNMTAEFWINELNAEDAINDTGIWLYCATDQVRFFKGEEEEIDLVDIPKLVFSEIMRDVDLFVGVASVGNDPAWQDNSGLPQFNDYWESYSFGDLTAVAKTRKGILEKLLPRLKISKVASIDGKFLIVKGTKRTYKIHIGSTNILMEPNDQYLCIVPARGASKSNDKLFIPFEGDKGFSILLSKAFMLAEDNKITDATILSQIG